MPLMLNLARAQQPHKIPPGLILGPAPGLWARTIITSGEHGQMVAAQVRLCRTTAVGVGVLHVQANRSAVVFAWARGRSPTFQVEPLAGG